MLFVLALYPTLLLAIIGLAVGLGIWLVRRMKGQDEGRDGLRVGSATAGCAAIPLLLLFAIFAGIPAITSLRPASYDFEEGFGFAPGDEIQHLQGSTQSGLDSRTIYLAFDGTTAARTMLERKLDGAMHRQPSDMLASGVIAGNVPSWFKAANQWTGANVCSQQKYLEISPWYDWNDLIIVDCESDGRIYAMFSNAD